MWKSSGINIPNGASSENLRRHRHARQRMDFLICASAHLEAVKEVEEVVPVNLDRVLLPILKKIDPIHPPPEPVLMELVHQRLDRVSASA